MQFRSTHEPQCGPVWQAPVTQATPFDARQLNSGQLGGFEDLSGLFSVLLEEQFLQGDLQRLAELGFLSP